MRRADNVQHSAAAIIGIALRQLEETDTVAPSTRRYLTEARARLRAMCPRCVEEDEQALRGVLGGQG